MNYAFIRLTRAVEDNTSYRRINALKLTPYNGDNKPPLTSKDIDHLFALVDEQGLTEHINEISFSGGELDKDCLLDLSKFINLKTLNISGNSLAKPPIINTCHILENINLSNNNLSSLPKGLENLTNLQDCDLRGNSLQLAAIKKLELLDRKNTARGSTKFAYDISGDFDINVIKSFDIDQLIKEFVKLVNLRVKSQANIVDIYNVRDEFKDKFKQFYGKNPEGFSELLKKYCDYSLPYSYLRHMLNFSYGGAWRKRSRNNSPEFPYNCAALNTLEGIDSVKHYTSQDIWLPDYSFISGKTAMQQTIGKKTHTTNLPTFPRGMLLSMDRDRWTETNRYLTPHEKKQLKVRNKNGVLKRNIDENKPCMPAGKYTYALSAHGGLTAALSENVQGTLYHSILRAGQYVLCAGHLTVDDHGKITDFDGNSGHMQPPNVNLYTAAIYLHATGILGHDCNVGPYGSKKITIKDLTENLSEYIKDNKTVAFLKMKTATDWVGSKKNNSSIDIEDLGVALPPSSQSAACKKDGVKTKIL